MPVFADMSVWQLAPALMLGWLGYIVGLCLYRLTIHPLARFPGPKIAAVTRYYEAYWDLVQNGQYTFQIERLHKQYGPIIRISPHELHVDDPAFFDQIYRQDGRWDKYDWAVDAWASYGAALFTVDHYHHKSRRQIMNPFFSRANIAITQNQAKPYLEKLCARINTFTSNEENNNTPAKVFNLGAAATAVIRDATHKFVVGQSCNDLDEEDFRVAMTGISNGLGRSWRMGKHVRWFMPFMKFIPRHWVTSNADDDTKQYFIHHTETLSHATRLIDSYESRSADPDQPKAIVDLILESKLDASEKQLYRVYQELSSIIGASFEPTSNAIRLALFHVNTKPDILILLRKELKAANISSVDDLDVSVLEKLPYLSAVVKEGLRLSPGQATRMARVAPDRVLTYNEWCIPAGTPVGMTTILMQTDERFCDEPKEFIPSRWLDEASKKKLDKVFYPFSKGTRSCLGRNLAWAIMHMVIATLVIKFDFEFPTAKAEDFECSSDQFAVGTSGGGNLLAKAKLHSD